MTETLPQRADIGKDPLDEAARHEAGHAVMRWLCGLPATGLTVSDDGSGYCAGTGQRIRFDDHLRVTLAGVAAESGLLGSANLDWERIRFADIDYTRSLLAGSLRAPGPDAALRAEFDCVCNLLWPHFEFIEAIADRLYEARALPARSVAALCREYARRLPEDQRP